MSSTHSQAGKANELVRALAIYGKVQSYPWGKVGAASRIAPILRGVVPEGPLAEYWIGGHPKGCAEVELPDGRRNALSEFLRQHAPHFGSCQTPTGLPFMVKVLSVDPTWGLSIQAHPDRAQAQALHASDPQNYPDLSHKPEVGIPLSRVTLLYGFKTLAELRDIVQRCPELHEILPAELTRGTVIGEPELSECDVRRGALSAVLHAPTAVREKIVRAITGRFQGREDTPEEVLVIERLRRRYGDGDVGLLVILLMNIRTVLPGQAIFIDSNIPHAYLDGDLVEVMACSDNVVRAGLTPKFKDIETLLGMLNYSVGAPEMLVPHMGEDGFMHIVLPVQDFSVSLLPRGSGRVELTAGEAAQVLLSLGDRSVVRMPDLDMSLELRDGGAALIPPGSGRYQIERDDAALYRVTAGA